MTRRLILHVGMPKCGSTYLQRVLLRNQALLASRGIHYPHAGTGHPGNAAGIKQLDKPTYDGFFAKGMHTVFLSHEDLFSMAKTDGRALAKLVQDDKAAVQILAFLRPFSDFVFGDYSQFMKQFFEDFLASRAPYKGKTFDEFALSRVEKLQPAVFLSDWQERLGNARIRVASHRAILPVLGDILGEDLALDTHMPREQTNPSLRMIDCDRIADAMRNPDVSEADIRALFAEAFQKTQDPDPGRTLARRALIETAYAPQNAALQEAFGYDNRLPGLAVPVPPAQDGS